MMGVLPKRRVSGISLRPTTALLISAGEMPLLRPTPLEHFFAALLGSFSRIFHLPPCIDLRSPMRRIFLMTERGDRHQFFQIGRTFVVSLMHDYS
jgi:hypothetical protein